MRSVVRVHPDPPLKPNSGRLAGAGMAKQAAEAIAEEIVTHSDAHLATKADIAGIKAEIGALRVELNAFEAEFRSQIKMLTSLIIGLYPGLALLSGSKWIG